MSVTPKTLNIFSAITSRFTVVLLRVSSPHDRSMIYSWVNGWKLFRVQNSSWTDQPTQASSQIRHHFCGLRLPSELRNKMHAEADRAARLVELVQNKVLLDSQLYHTFVGILRSNYILRKLDQTYCSHLPNAGWFVKVSLFNWLLGVVVLILSKVLDFDVICAIWS